MFFADELRNKIDLHHLRALHAQRAYQYYLEQTKNPEAREKLLFPIMPTEYIFV
jgi:hypothetical protein